MKKGQGFARRVTKKNLGTFAPLLAGTSKASEAERKTAEARKKDTAFQNAENEFNGVSLVFETPAKYRGKRRATKKPAGKKRVKRVSKPERKVRTHGRLLWEKPKLDASSVLHTSRSGTHAVGACRLTKAGFKVDGELIDQTTYFRHDVFGAFTWEDVTAKSERIWVEFDVTILGKRLGIRTLQIRHKPSGEAGQHNYTTSLHWGKLGKTVRDMDLVGKRLCLYAPAKGTKEPFFLEIS